MRAQNSDVTGSAAGASSLDAQLTLPYLSSQERARRPRQR